MSEWDYSDPIGPGMGWDTGGYDYGGYSEPIGPGMGWDFSSSPAYQQFTGWDAPTGPGSSGDPSADSGGGDWLSALLSGGGQALASLFRTGGAGGPLLSALGSLGGGAIGSNASSDAARLQSQALNRGIDLQTAQWLQQQQNLAPYLQAGQQGLSTLQSLAGREQPQFQDPAAAVSGLDYQLPGTQPGWTPQTYQGPQAPNAGDYRWTPGQGPQAAAYRYTPGSIPQASQYRYTPGQTPDAAQYASGAPQLYQGAMPGTQVSTLTGQQVLDQDPGAAFRQSEARKALEGSAAARGELLSGGTLQALQARSQDLASQEYGNAWERMMRRNTEQYGRDWGQYQQQWNQGVTGTQLGLQTTAQNFQQAQAAAALREQVNQVASQQGWSQAQAEAALREQVNQVASQQGWSQAQTEAVFREQMAQQASQQGFNQALGAQGQQFSQGLQAQQWNTGQQQKFESDLYGRQLEQSKLRYGQALTQNQTDYDRAQALYKQRLGQFLLPFEQNSTLANLGGQAVGMYGNQGANAASGISNLLAQLGQAQGTGAAGQGLMWQRALTGAANQVPSILSSLNS